MSHLLATRRASAPSACSADERPDTLIPSLESIHLYFSISVHTRDIVSDHPYDEHDETADHLQPGTCPRLGPRRLTNTDGRLATRGADRSPQERVLFAHVQRLDGSMGTAGRAAVA